MKCLYCSKPLFNLPTTSNLGWFCSSECAKQSVQVCIETEKENRKLRELEDEAIDRERAHQEYARKMRRRSENNSVKN